MEDKDIEILVKLEVSENTKQFRLDFSDLDVTKKEWEEMSISEKQKVIENAVFNLYEKPYWIVTSFDEL